MTWTHSIRMTHATHQDLEGPDVVPLRERPKDLLNALRAHERQACQEFWEGHAPLVRGLLRRSLGAQDEDALEDLIQQVFITVFEKLHRVQRAQDLRSFVVGVTMNHARNALRSRQRWYRRFLFTEDASITAPPASDAVAEHHVALARLYELLDRMSVELRLAFVLRHIELLEMEQVAQGLGVSLATAKRRVKKSRDLMLKWAQHDPWLASYMIEETEHAHDDT